MFIYSIYSVFWISMKYYEWYDWHNLCHGYILMLIYERGTICNLILILLLKRNKNLVEEGWEGVKKTDGREVVKSGLSYN